MIGYITATDFKSAKGESLTKEQAIRHGLVVPGVVTDDFVIPEDEIPLGYNLNMSAIRQYLAYLVGNRQPATNYVAAKFGVGTGTTAPTVDDTGLQAPINFYLGNAVKPIDSSDFPEPFVVRFNFTLDSGEANGYLITEMGLFAGDDTLLSRKTLTGGINKDSSFSHGLTWRIRM
jgi:hypothetical protein